MGLEPLPPGTHDRWIAILLQNPIGEIRNQVFFDKGTEREKTWGSSRMEPPTPLKNTPDLLEKHHVTVQKDEFVDPVPLHKLSEIYPSLDTPSLILQTSGVKMLVRVHEHLVPL
jgi:hypothetical protein